MSPPFRSMPSDRATPITVSSFLATGSSYAGGTLTLSGLPKSVALDIRGHTLSGFVVTDNSVLDETIITASAPCFCGGTLIRTTHGDIPVERLQQGDRVLALDGGARPIRWIGHRSADLARHRAPDQMCPVRGTAQVRLPRACRRATCSFT